MTSHSVLPKSFIFLETSFFSAYPLVLHYFSLLSYLSLLLALRGKLVSRCAPRVSSPSSPSCIVQSSNPSRTWALHSRVTWSFVYFAFPSCSGSTSGHPELIDELSLEFTLQSLAHRSTIASLSLFYRYYFGFCYSKLASAVLPVTFSRSAQTQAAGHSYQVSVASCCTSLFQSSFSFRISKLWNTHCIPPRLQPFTFQEQDW